MPLKKHCPYARPVFCYLNNNSDKNALEVVLIANIVIPNYLNVAFVISLPALYY